MYTLIVILIIIVEFLVASWLIYFFSCLDSAVIAINRDLSKNKSEICEILFEYRLKLKKLNKHTINLQEDEKAKKLIRVLKLLSFMFLLRHKGLKF